MTQEQTKTPMTAKELLKKLVGIHTEINAQKDYIKEIKGEVKESNPCLDFGSINDLAQKEASFKTEQAKAKARAFIETADELT